MGPYRLIAHLKPIKSTLVSLDSFVIDQDYKLVIHDLVMPQAGLVFRFKEIEHQQEGGASTSALS